MPRTAPAGGDKGGGGGSSSDGFRDNPRRPEDRFRLSSSSSADGARDSSSGPSGGKHVRSRTRQGATASGGAPAGSGSDSSPRRKSVKATSGKIQVSSRSEVPSLLDIAAREQLKLLLRNAASSETAVSHPAVLPETAFSAVRATVAPVAQASSSVPPAAVLPRVPLSVPVDDSALPVSSSTAHALQASADATAAADELVRISQVQRAYIKMPLKFIGRVTSMPFSSSLPEADA